MTQRARPLPSVTSIRNDSPSAERFWYVFQTCGTFAAVVRSPAINPMNVWKLSMIAVHPLADPYRLISHKSLFRPRVTQVDVHGPSRYRNSQSRRKMSRSWACVSRRLVRGLGDVLFSFWQNGLVAMLPVLRCEARSLGLLHTSWSDPSNGGELMSNPGCREPGGRRTRFRGETRSQPHADLVVR
jgi:hypothetical protein